jgi:hypothetical protein
MMITVTIPFSESPCQNQFIYLLFQWLDNVKGNWSDQTCWRKWSTGNRVLS